MTLIAAPLPRTLLDEVALLIDDQANSFSFSSPWLEVDGQADPALLRSAGIVFGHSSATVPSDADLARSYQFLDALKEYPVSYPLPRPGLSPATAVFRLQTEFWRTPSNLLDQACKSKSNTPACFHGASWEWNCRDLIERSSNAVGRIDPATLQALLNRQRLAHEVETGRKRDLLARLRVVEEETFVEAARKLIAQALLVTLRADAILAAAAATHIRERAILDRLRREERGHHRFMEQALEGLPGGSRSGASCWYVETELELLALAANTSLLAFACVLSVFEGAPSDDEPLAAILDERGFADAASGLRAHWRVNRSHDHEGIAEEICGQAGVPSREEAEFAIRLVELCAWLQNQVEGVMDEPAAAGR